MAADERLFEPQLREFPNLTVQPWIEPLHRESLRAYAARLARIVDPGQPCFVGGASFGGLVALEMAAHLRAEACFLIGSVRSSDELPWQWRVFRLIAPIVGPEHINTLAGTAARVGSPMLSRGTIRRMRKLAAPRAAFVRWACWAVVRWRPSPAARRVRVLQIHGAADRVLPVARTRPDMIVPYGAHALTLSHPRAVNDFLRAGMSRV
ncbi:hypothetical protein FRUB_07877 [Fimbriiglobus ruber]|uniref:AB hydrolase-1 domain-containing protein n=2 Tax=Fimbriiglobus ruber TaxID=1908690 RepID=A0A225DKM5_9BACT|nr:hypothetical protein FRUB_07877 [Fimbriiglobus ruber]